MNQLEKYLKKRFRIILFLSGKSRNQWTPETFHQLRVEIKKLNACFELINFCNPSFKQNKTFLPLKSLFRQAGILREMHVEELLLKKYFLHHMLPTYLSTIKTKKQTDLHGFFNMLKELTPSKIKKIEKKISGEAVEIKMEAVQNYLRRKQKKIFRPVFNNKISNDDFHKLRIGLKQYAYILQIYKRITTGSLIEDNKELLDLLGRWHDLHTSTIHLKTARAKGLFYHKETMQFNIVTDQLLKEMNRLNLQIKESIATMPDVYKRMKVEF